MYILICIYRDLAAQQKCLHVSNMKLYWNIFVSSIHNSHVLETTQMPNESRMDKFIAVYSFIQCNTIKQLE